MHDNLQAELDNTGKELVEVLNSLSDEDFNRKPSEDKWSAGQMSDHVLQSVTGFYDMFSGPGKPTERAADENFGMLEKVFLDFSTSLNSPEFILPRGEHFSKQEIVQALKEKFDAFVAAVPGTNLTEPGVRELPRLGALTKMEQIYFTIVHTKRHIHQAKKIKEMISLAA